MHLTLLPSVLAGTVTVDINTSSDITLDLLFSPEPTTYILTEGLHSFEYKASYKTDQNYTDNYLISDNLVDWNSEISQKVFSKFQGSKEEIIIQLVGYIQENIEYDLTSIAATGTKSVSWVLENKEGVCDEITAVFIAGARYHGIPSRFVNGYAYTTSELFNDPWQPHTWAEVYIEHEWIPIDITFNQYANIQNDHVTFTVSEYMETQQYSATYIDNEPKINIKYTVNYIPEMNVMNNKREVTYPSTINYNSDIPLHINTHNSDFKSLEIYVPKDFKIIKSPLIQKNATVWILPPLLDESYTYTIPITVSVNGDNTNHTITISNEGEMHTYQETSPEIDVWCKYEKELICYSETETVFCTNTCYEIDNKGTKIESNKTQGHNTLEGNIDGQKVIINYFVTGEPFIECRLNNINPTTLNVNSSQKIETVIIKTASPFETKIIEYNQIQNEVEHTFNFSTEYSGMPISSIVTHGNRSIECNNTIKIKSEGWEKITHLFYKIIAKIIA